MNIRTVCIALLALTVSGVIPVGFEAAAQRKKKEKIDVFGYYFLNGRVAKELSDIDHLHLSTIDDRGKDAPLNGMIRLKARGRAKPVDFVFAQVKLNGKALTFTSRSVKGVSYKFVGTFVKIGDFPANPPTKGTILEGQLTRTEGRKKTFDGKVSFRYEPGG